MVKEPKNPFLRQKAHGIRGQLAGRDYQILDLLRDYRFLRIDQLMLLLPPEVKRIYPRAWRPYQPREGWLEKIDEEGRSYWEVEEARGLRALQTRLQVLFNSGYITRPPKQRDYLKPRAPLVYGLGNKGATALSERDGLEKGQVNWQRLNREAGLAYIEHTLMLADFRGTLTLALRNREDVRLVAWYPESPRLNHRVRVGQEWLPIRPDSVFTLELEGQARPYRNYAVEIDRSTMTNRRFLQKLLAYWHGREEYLEKLNTDNLQVLTVTISGARRDNLQKLAAQVSGEGGDTFLFASAEDFRLEEPGSVLREIWGCGDAGCGEWHTLVDN